MPALDLAVLNRPERLVAVERARRVLADLALPLDGIARLCARLLDAPMAAVCLVAGDELLAGRHGVLPPLDEVRRVPMEYSVGKYIVSADQPVAVEDMATYPELRDHPLVTEHGVRSFIGVPLHDTGGVPLGSITVADLRPRPWTERDVAVLHEVAAVFDPVPDSDGPLATLPDLESATLLDVVAEAFVAMDVDGRLVGWNRAAEEIFGWSATEALGQRMDRLILVEPVGAEFAARLASQARTPAGRPRRERGVAHRRDGTRFPFEAFAHTLRSPYGPIVCGFVVDVSDRENAERDADRRRRFLDAVLESLQTMVVACDAAGNLVIVNRPLREFYGLSDVFSPLPMAPLAPTALHLDGTPMRPDELPLMRALAGAEVRDEAIVVRPPDQPGREFLVNARPITASDGQRLGAVAALLDVTERRRAERFRACELEVVKALAYAGSVPEAGRAVVAAIAGTLRWPYGELWLVDNVENAIKQVATWSAPGRDHRALAHETLASGEGLAGAVWREGELRWLPDLAEAPDARLADAAARAGLRAAVAMPVRAASGTVGVLAVFSDEEAELTESTKALLAGLVAHLGSYLTQRRATGLAAELGRSRDDFVSLVGHAVRTPLTSIASYTDLLLAGAAGWSEQDRHMLRVVQRHTENLRSIVDDLLDLAGLEAGQLRLDRRETDAVEVVRASVAGMRELADANHVTIVPDLPAAAPLVADPGRLRQLLDNLLSNAVKYSPDGGHVRARLRPVGDAIEITVQDEGVGVPAGERDRLFQRFFRASNAIERGIQGTGLGLSIARAIAEAHGGLVAFDAPGGGSAGTVLTVRLPVRPGDQDG